VFGNKRKKEKALALMNEGAVAVGTLTDVRDTGVTINDMQIRVKLELDIAPLDGSPVFRGEKTTMVSRVRVPQVGARYPVYYDRAEPETFAFVSEVTDEAGRATIVAKFGDAFGHDASGVGMAAAASSPPTEGDSLDQLEKLGRLHASGVLTDEEFAAQKAQILGG
jgi:Short C-terminal domain